MYDPMGPMDRYGWVVCYWRGVLGSGLDGFGFYVVACS